MLYVIAVAFFGAGFLLKNNKAYSLLIAAFLSYLIGKSTSYGDYANYLIIYDNSALRYGEGRIEIGWQTLCLIGNYLNLPYEIFISLVVFFFLILLDWVIRQFSERSPFVWSLLLIFPIFVNLVQIRQFAAMIIGLLGIYYMCKPKSLSSVVKAVFILLLATTFHYTAVFFFGILLLFFLSKDRLKLTIVLCITAFGLSLIFSETIFSMTVDLFDDKLTNVKYGSIDYVVLLGMLSEFILVELISRKLIKKIDDKKIINFIQTVRIINWVLLSIIPLIASSGGLTRLQYYKYPINYVLLSIFVCTKNGQYKEKSLFDVALIVVYIIYVIVRGVALNSSMFEWFTGALLGSI